MQITATGGTGFAARDIKVNLLRAVAADGRELHATRSVLHRGKRLAIATEVMHGDERVAVLTGTTALTPPAGRRSTHGRHANGMGLSMRNPAAGADTSAATSLTQARAGARR